MMSHGLAYTGHNLILTQQCKGNLTYLYVFSIAFKLDCISNNTVNKCPSDCSVQSGTRKRTVFAQHIVNAWFASVPLCL